MTWHDISTAALLHYRAAELPISRGKKINMGSGGNGAPLSFSILGSGKSEAIAKFIIALGAWRGGAALPPEPWQCVIFNGSGKSLVQRFKGSHE